MERNSFVFYRSFRDILRKLSQEEQLAMYDAIADYALDGKEPELSGTLEIIFMAFRPQIDANTKRWENGRKGGAPYGSHNNPYGRRGKRTDKAETNQELTKTNQELTKNKPNVNENVNENVQINKFANNNNNNNNNNTCENENENEKKRIAIMTYFNTERKKRQSRIPQVRKIDDDRRALLDAVLANYTEEQIHSAIDNMLASPYCNGRIDSHRRTASFDWLFSITDKNGNEGGFPKAFENRFD